jgi:hypothetical protein
VTAVIDISFAEFIVDQILRSISQFRHAEKEDQLEEISLC